MTRQQGNNLVCLDVIIRAGHPDFYAARAYEIQVSMNDHDNKVSHGGNFYGDIAQRSGATEKQQKANASEAYKLIDSLFPELTGKGQRSEGYSRYTLDEVSGILG